MNEITINFTSRAEWRDWLGKNHDKKSIVWLLFYKRHTGRACVKYNDAVEEALCFGWIDSVVKSIDEISYCRKFTPRRKGSKWSQSNILRATDMTKRGLMRPSGQKCFEEALENPSLILESMDNNSELIVPDDLAEAIKLAGQSSKFFNQFSVSYRNMCIRWITAARREDTRERRILELVEKTVNGEKIGLK